MMTHENDIRITPPSLWRSRIIFAILVSLCFIALLMATGVVWRTFFNDPPIAIRSLNPAHLGTLCPGDETIITNQVTIHDDVIVHYFVSVMDAETKANVPGMQLAYTDYLHPIPARIFQELVWEVPELPPGDYTRVFAARKVSGNEDTVFLIHHFTIGECLS